MLELRQLSICNSDDAVELYRKMIEENRKKDVRLANIPTDDRSIRNLLQYSFDIENNLFFVVYARNIPVGFIDSTRVFKEGMKDEWYIKSVFLEDEYQDPKAFACMVYKIEKLAKLKKIESVFSNSLMQNNEINTMWEHIGYTVEQEKRVKFL